MYRAATLLLLTLLQIASAAYALDRDECDRRFGVRIGNAGKDVIWVPTSDKLVTAMLQAAQTTPNDYVIDLGAGDGKIPIAAAKEFGARALGIEYDEKMVQLAHCYVSAEGLEEEVEIRRADIFETDLSDATVLTLYLLPKLNRKLRPTILALRPGTRVVSNRFDMGSWQPDATIRVEGVANHAYLWIVPARIQGRWQFEEPNTQERFTLRFEQKFQRVRASSHSPRVAVRHAHLRGTNLDLTLTHKSRNVELHGIVTADRIELRGMSDGERVEYVGVRR